MAYKFQEGNANFDGEISGSSFRTAGSLSGSGDLAVTGNMHAAQYYGDGSSLTNISAELIDVTGSSDNAAFKLAFVENLGTGVDLAGNVGLNYNPSTAVLSSSAGVQFVGESFFGGAVNISGTLTVGSGSVSLSGSGISGSGNTQMVSGNYSGALLVSGALTVGTGSVTINALGGNQLSSSAGAVFVSSISSSGDLAVTGNVHAAQFYGGGAGITGISSDAVDVTGALGASLVYGIVGTEAIQSDGTLGLITTVSGASFNPLDATWGSILALSGSKSGEQASQIQFGGRGGLGIIDEDGDSLVLSSSIAGISISGAHDSGIMLYGGQGAEAGVGIAQSPFYMFADSESDPNYSIGYADGAVSGAAGAQFVGAAILGNTLHVSGTISGAVALQGASVAVDGTVAGLKFTTNDVTYGDSGITMDADGGHFTLEQDDADKSVLVVLGAAGAKTSGFQIRNSSDSPLWGVTDDGHVSGSGILEVVGASTFVGAMKMSGTVRMETGNSLSFNGSTNTAKITNNGSNLDVNSPGPIILNAATFVSSGVGAQFVGNSIFGGTLGLTGAADFESTLEVQSGVYNHGYRRYEMSTITANTELTASSSKSYQMVSGGTSALTVILPSASAGQYYQYGIKRHSLMSGNVVIEGGGSELIDGETNITLSTVNASVFLISDGTQWNIF